jgi:hypothetical protein
MIRKRQENARKVGNFTQNGLRLRNLCAPQVHSRPHSIIDEDYFADELWEPFKSLYSIESTSA